MKFFQPAYCIAIALLIGAAVLQRFNTEAAVPLLVLSALAGLAPHLSA